MTTSLRIKNWDSYQHYKHRTPPWIKLHRSLLDDMDYHACDPMAAKHLPLIWLIASENGGNLPTVEKLAFRLRVSASKCADIIKALSSWICTDAVQGASTMLADCKQDAMPEKSRVEESREEICPPPNPLKGESLMSSDFLSFWNAYPNKKGKKAACRAWQRAKDRPSIETILAEVQLQTRSEEWTKDGGAYIPHPATWINRGGWDDVVKPLGSSSTQRR